VILAKWLKILRAVRSRTTYIAAAQWLISRHPEYTDADQKEIMATAREMDEQDETL